MRSYSNFIANARPPRGKGGMPVPQQAQGGWGWGGVGWVFVLGVGGGEALTLSLHLPAAYRFGLRCKVESSGGALRAVSGVGVGRMGWGGCRASGFVLRA